MTEQSIVWLLSIAVLGTLLLSFLAYRTASEALRVAQAGGSGAPAANLSKADRKGAELLAQRASALLAKVNALPPAMLGPGADAKVREAPLWVAAEVASLRETAPALRSQTDEPLSEVEPGMAWLLERVTAIRATPKGSGQYLIDFPHDQWRKNHQRALTGLQELVARSAAAVK
jgi:hypothetical protein